MTSKSFTRPAETFWKNMCLIPCSLFTRITYILTFSPTLTPPLWSWGAVSWLQSSFLPQIKFSSQLSHCVSFKSTFSSVQFIRSVVSDSLQPHESQHARPPCPSPTPEVHSDSRASTQWCHPAISSSVIRLSSCPRSFPASGSFQMNQLFAWGGQSIGVSALASFLPKNTRTDLL